MVLKLLLQDIATYVHTHTVYMDYIILFGVAQILSLIPIMLARFYATPQTIMLYTSNAESNI